MNRNLIIASMVASFKEANIKLAVENNISEKEAREYVETMSQSIEKCMENVLDNLLNDFPNFIK